MRKAYYTLLVGLIFEAAGALWDLSIHSQRAIEEGLEVFFAIPAHDLILLGFVVNVVGFALLTRELWRSGQS